MTIGELKDLIEGYEDDVEIRWAAQPSWPFEYSISDAQVVEVADDECEECGGEGCETCHGTGFTTPELTTPIVYLVEGQQLAYLPGVVSRAIGWGRG